LGRFLRKIASQIGKNREEKIGILGSLFVGIAGSDKILSAFVRLCPILSLFVRIIFFKNTPQ